MYNISIYITVPIAKNDNYTIGGEAKYFMRAEKGEKTVMERIFSYRDDTVKRNGLYIYGMYDALGHIKGTGHTIDFFVDDKYVVITSEKTLNQAFYYKNGEPIKNADGWEKLYKKLHEMRGQTETLTDRHPQQGLRIIQGISILQRHPRG